MFYEGGDARQMATITANWKNKEAKKKCIFQKKKNNNLNCKGLQYYSDISFILKWQKYKKYVFLLSTMVRIEQRKVKLLLGPCADIMVLDWISWY